MENRILGLGRRIVVAAALLASVGCDDLTGPPPVVIGKSEGDGVLGEWVHSGF